MNRAITTTFVGLLLLLSGCADFKNSRRRDWTQPVEATAEYESNQLGISSELVKQGQRFELAGKPDEAMARYQEAIGAYRENAVAWHNLGVLHAGKGKNLEAANAFKTASELSPSDPRPLYSLGVLWEELGYLEDAARWYDEALQRDPNHQNSLRRSILVDDLRHHLTQTTTDRIKTAILMEREPWWLNRFQRIQQRINEAPVSASSGERARPLPPPPMPASEQPAPGAPPLSPEEPPALDPTPLPPAPVPSEPLPSP